MSIRRKALMTSHQLEKKVDFSEKISGPRRIETKKYIAEDNGCAYVSFFVLRSRDVVLVCARQESEALSRSAAGEGLKMGKWALNDAISNSEDFLSFGRLSFGMSDVPMSEVPTTNTQSEVCVSMLHRCLLEFRV